MLLKLLTIGVISATLVTSPLKAQGEAKMDEPFPTKPFARLAASVTAVTDSIVAVARRQLGTPYRLGGKAPGKAFDCSGLVQYVMEHFDITLPRTSREQARVGIPVERKIEALKPGDLLTFGNSKRISHVGIYVGDGKFLHASSSKSRRVVTETRLSENGSWWRGARRIVSSSDSSSVEQANSLN